MAPVRRSAVRVGVPGVALTSPGPSPSTAATPLPAQPAAAPVADLPERGRRHRAGGPDALTASTGQIREAPTPPQVPATVLVAQDVEQVPPGDPSAEVLAAVDRVRPEAMARLAADIPGAQLVTVPDTSHYIQIQRPDAVIDAVRSVSGR